jgi:heptose-I-phosphate ethanolaminephosphotransferase
MTAATTPNERLPHAWRAWQGAPLTLAAVLLVFIVLGHDSRRAAQMAALALPLAIWVAWPVRSAAAHRLRAVLVWSLAMLFVLDGAVRHYLMASYQAAPDSAMVLGAAANTQSGEGLEYVQAYWPSLLWRGLAVLAGAGALWFAVRGAARAGEGQPARWPSRRVALAIVALLLVVAGVAHASKPWRRMHPALFWSQWLDSARQLRAGWTQQRAQQRHAHEQARKLAPTLADSAPATVMLVVGESVNRDNLALYGYGRPTSPRRLADKARLGEQMLVLRNAWSADASTLPALQNLFRFGQPERDDPPHLLALARAAGYKTWWIGNQDDMALENRHARLADEVELINRRTGRGADMLDGELLDEVERAMRDPAPRKLVVVHLMGAHPHYQLRHPAGANPFAGIDDAVEQAMRQAGRSGWTREERQEYDAALLYHDAVLSDLLDLLRGHLDPAGRGAWMYLSDHGQEVGHEVDRSGHSATTAAGYRIPAMVWRSDMPAGAASALADRPFRGDWGGWAVADLLGIDWPGRQPERSVLGPDYRWQPPKLGAEIASFTR